MYLGKLRIGVIVKSRILSQGPLFLCAENGFIRPSLYCVQATMHRALEGEKNPETMTLLADSQVYGDPLLLIRF